VVEEAAAQQGGNGSVKRANLPVFPVSKAFFPALVGTHMEEMSRVLDETRKQLAALKEHHRVTLHAQVRVGCQKVDVFCRVSKSCT